VISLTKLAKYQEHGFGTCPRHHCNSQAVLPCGITDEKGKSSVKLYCPRCEEIYAPPSARHESIDGACFGTTFAHLFFLVFPELKPEKSADHYVPRAFGFKLHHSWHQRSLEATGHSHHNEPVPEQERSVVTTVATPTKTVTPGEPSYVATNVNNNEIASITYTQQQPQSELNSQKNG